MTTITDIIDGAITETEGKLQHVRVFIVDGLKGGPAARLYSAMTAAGIPPDNDPHPVIPRIRVIARQVEPQDRDNKIARVMVTYGIPELTEDGNTESGNGQWSFSSELVTETVTEDIRGRRMQTVYAQFSIGRYSLTRLIHEVEVDRPMFTARCRRTEKRLDRSKIRAFSGTINRHTWSGESPRRWLCRISAEPNQKGSFDYEYVFHLARDLWNADISSRIDGEIPINAVLGNGRAKYDVYPRASFSALGLRMPK